MISELRFLILIPLPFIIYYFVKFIIVGKFSSLILYVLITISFIKGSLALLGVIDSNYNILIQDILLCLLFIITIGKKNNKSIFINSGILVLFIIFSFLTSIFNRFDIFTLLMYFRKTLYFMIVFYTFYNYNFTDYESNLVKKYLIALFLCQTVVSFIKFAFVGITEFYIGTMSIEGGSLTTFFAMMGLGYTFVYYLKTKGKIFILLIFIFILFSIIGDKRATIFFTIIVFLLVFYYYQYIVYNKSIFSSRSFRRIPVIAVLAIFLFYITVRLLPALNPEYKIGGSFSLKHIVSFTLSTTSNRSTDFATNYGRADAPAAVFELLSNSSKLGYGFGAGDLIISKYNNPSGLRLEDYIGVKYDIGYGARTGLLWMGLQVGLIGVLLYMSFYLKLFNMVIKKTRAYKNMNDKVVGIILFSFFIMFFF